MRAHRRRPPLADANEVVSSCSGVARPLHTPRITRFETYMTLPPWGTAGRDRRRWERRAARPGVRVTCHTGPGDAGPDVAVGLLDVSEAGIRLMTNAELAIGQQIEVTFLSPDSQPVTTAGRVVWCLPGVIDGIFTIGILFDACLPAILKLTRQSDGDKF
jgi:hypothetical protein